MRLQLRLQASGRSREPEAKSCHAQPFVSVSIAGALLSCAGFPCPDSRRHRHAHAARRARRGGRAARRFARRSRSPCPRASTFSRTSHATPPSSRRCSTVNPPEGVTVTEIVFPTPVDLKQLGIDQPLAVFERVFPIGVQFTLARSVARGDIVVPARLRYQACNDTTCFAPKTADTEWRLRIGPAAAAGAATTRGGLRSHRFRTWQATATDSGIPLNADRARGPHKPRNRHRRKRPGRHTRRLHDPGERPADTWGRTTF